MAMTDVNLDRIECQCYEQGMQFAERYISFRQGNHDCNIQLHVIAKILEIIAPQCREGFYDTMDAYIADWANAKN